METGLESEQGKVSAGKLLTLGDLLKFLFRRRLLILGTAAFFMLLGILYSAFGTRRYLSTVTVEIKKPDNSLGLNNLIPGSGQSSGEDNPLEENVNMATKVEELQSDTLGLRVVQELSLETNKDFKGHISLNPLGLIAGLFSTPSKKDAPGTPFLQSPTRRTKALSTLKSHLKVEIIPGTRLISVSFSNPDPEVAASVVNALVSDLSRYTFETRFNSTQQLSTWLEDQLESVRERADQMQEQESQLRRDTETYTLGGTNAAGQSMVYSPLIDHLQQSTQALSQAESNAVLRAAVDQIARTRDPKLISGLAGSGAFSGANLQSATSLDVIKTLQGNISQQEVLISQDALRLGDQHPKLIQEQAQLLTLQKSLQDETERLVQRAGNDYSIAKEEEQRTRTTHAELIKKANAVNDKALHYEIVHQEAQDARNLYTDLNRRLREAGVIAGLQSADMTIVSSGMPADKPNSPKVLLILPASIFMGLIFGVMIAGVVDVRDDKVNNVNTVESELGIPVYAVTPDFNLTSSVYGYGKSLYTRYSGKGEPSNRGEDNRNKLHNVAVVAEPDSQYAEAMRVLRTAILLSKTGATPKVLLITSSTPGEGKSTTSANLATTFAKTGVRTLLVEIDLRKPVISRRLGLPRSDEGLSRILTGHVPESWVVEVPGIPNLFCIPAGQRPPDPHELISSALLKSLIEYWRTKYDLIILDGPPVLPVIDSVLVSEYADLVLVITRFGRTSINSLRTTHRLLSRQVKANIGAVLNAVAQGSEGYYEYYGYKSNSYKYEGEEEI